MKPQATLTRPRGVSDEVISKVRQRCLRKFLKYFKEGYRDETYISWERDYKFQAHTQFKENLSKEKYAALLKAGKYAEIALEVVRIESRTNLLFSFEKMALRDAIKLPHGARLFAEGLFRYVYGSDPIQDRFEYFVEVVRRLPRKQTRVLTWPLVTVFGFIGDPKQHIFLKPRVTQLAAEKYKFDFYYNSKPNWETYQSLLDFAGQVKKDTRHLKPRDYIDLQSFIWVMGSDEYP